MNASSSPSQNGRRSRAGLLRRSFVWLLAIGLIAALIAGFRPRPIEVETAVVSSGPMSVFVLEEGKTRIRHRHTISPPVAGMLERIPLRAGEKIEAGKTVLATIQPAPSNFLDPRTMAEAEARVQAAQANQQLRAAQQERAQSALELANKEKARLQLLLKTGAISVREMDQAANRSCEKGVHVLQSLQRARTANGTPSVSCVANDAVNIEEVISPQSVSVIIFQVIVVHVEITYSGTWLGRGGHGWGFRVTMSGKVVRCCHGRSLPLLSAEIFSVRWRTSRHLRGHVSHLRRCEACFPTDILALVTSFRVACYDHH